MGVWNNDGGPGLVHSFFIYSNKLFAVTDSGDGVRGPYERTGAATWVYRKPAAAADISHVCVWNGLIWAANLSNVWYSSDAVNWTLDWTAPVNQYIRAMNGYGNYLYIVYQETVGIVEQIAHFARRNTSGVWATDCFAQYQHPLGGGNSLTSYDIIEFGDYTYWSVNEQNIAIVVKRWTGAAWQDDPNGSTIGIGYFKVHNLVLYAASQTLKAIWKCTSNTWSQDFAPGLFACYGRLSVGADSLLWIAFQVDMFTTRTYKRDGSWAATAHGDRADLGGGAIVGVDEHPYLGCLASIFRNADLVPTNKITPSGGYGTPPQGLACDGNGDAIYVALYNTAGNPVLIKTVLPMHHSHIGTRIFNPGLGDAINVKTSEFTGDYVIISGKFAANDDTCRRSINGGTTLTDIDDDWGSDRSQPIGLDVNDDNHILLPIDGATDDLVETEDAATWVILDDTLPFDVSALAIYDLDPNELFIGNIAAGAILVKYSPNNGSTWSDITGTLDVLGGIANIEVV